MRELLSIQCGNTANYIGTHFWNFQDPTAETQEDINHDVLFSAGQARNGNPTYTPRLLIYDHARNFGSMKRINALFAEPDAAAPPGTQVIQPERIEEHPYQTSLEQDGLGDASTLKDESVRYWSDYNTQFYRPASYLPISTFGDSISTTQFQDFELGVTTYKTRTKANDVLDTDVRPFLEECDAVSLLLLTTSLIDAWAGYSSHLLLDLSTELPKTPKLVLSTSAARTRHEDVVLGTSLLTLHDEVDAIVPFDCTPSWQDSAATSTWVDSLTLPFRTQEDTLTFGDITSFMVPGHKLLTPRLNGTLLGPIDGPAERQFRVIRGDADVKQVRMDSKLVNGRLVTTYRHPSQLTYPTSFPESARLDKIRVSLEDSALGASKYIADTRHMISGIRGAAGYTDRKEQVEELVELEGRYRNELLESEDSSDEDGF